MPEDDGFTGRVASVAERVDAPLRAGSLAGAPRVGEASAGGRIVRVGFWLSGGRAVRARFRATSCASLIAYADAACEALEAGLPPEALDAERLRALVSGVHPVHHDRAELVSAAIRAALTEEGE